MLHPPTKPPDRNPGVLLLCSSSSVARDPRARPVAETARPKHSRAGKGTATIMRFSVIPKIGSCTRFAKIFGRSDVQASTAPASLGTRIPASPTPFEPLLRGLTTPTQPQSGAGRSYRASPMCSPHRRAARSTKAADCARTNHRRDVEPARRAAWPKNSLLRSRRTSRRVNAVLLTATSVAVIYTSLD
jgi:hypothetical protein